MGGRGGRGRAEKREGAGEEEEEEEDVEGVWREVPETLVTAGAAADCREEEGLEDSGRWLATGGPSREREVILSPLRTVRPRVRLTIFSSGLTLALTGSTRYSTALESTMLRNWSWAISVPTMYLLSDRFA